MTKPIREMTPREFRFYLVMNRRKMNAMARSRGFRNYAVMSAYVD